jgi:hypothetical protein
MHLLSCSFHSLHQQHSSQHIDFEVHKFVFFPTECAGGHWSLLVYSTLDNELYSLDPGRVKLFAHTDSHYGPAIGQIENLAGPQRQHSSI